MDAKTNEAALRCWGIGVFEVDRCTGEWDCSAEFLQLYGLGSSNITAEVVLANVPARDQRELAAMLRGEGVEASNLQFDLVHCVRANNGSFRWLHVRGEHALEGPTEQALLAVTRGSVVDVTARVESEGVLHQIRQRFEQAVRVSQLGIFDHDHVSDPAGENVYWSPELRQLAAVEDDQPGGFAAFGSLVHPEDQSRVGAAVAKAHAPSGSGHLDLEHRIIRPSGEVRWVMIRCSTIFHGTGLSRKPLRTVGAVLDVTDHRCATEALKRQAAILDATPDFVAIAEPGASILYLNRAAREFMGIGPQEDIRHRRMSEAHPTEAMDEIVGIPASVARKEGSWTGQSNFLRHDNTIVPMSQVLLAHFDENENTVLYSTIARDLSRERALEERVGQAQKMEAVGRLAGGVAHDFNNILSAIIGFAGLAAEGIAPGQRGRSELDEITAAAERAASLTRQLLAFSRKQVSRPRLVDVNSVLGSMGPMIRRLLGEGIEVCIRPWPTAAYVKADPVHLEQILLNLSVNAIDAMPEGGSLELQAHCVELCGEQALRLELSSGTYVRMSVSDTGIGIAPEAKEHIFEPFFTTKGHGQGTGLGLSTVFGIVKQSGGAIVAESAAGQGTTFRVYLPCTNEFPTKRVTPKPVRRLNDGGVILVAEDDAPLRKVLVTVLEMSGFTPLAAGGPEQALELARQHVGTIDLLLTDVVMPKMNGKQLAEALNAELGPIPVLFMSGYTNDTIDDQGILDEGVNFVPKPITPDQLLAAIARVLRQG